MHGKHFCGKSEYFRQLTLNCCVSLCLLFLKKASGTFMSAPLNGETRWRQKGTSLQKNFDAVFTAKFHLQNGMMNNTKIPCICRGFFRLLFGIFSFAFWDFLITFVVPMCLSVTKFVARGFYSVKLPRTTHCLHIKTLFRCGFCRKNLQLRESTVFCNVLLHKHNKKDGFSTTVLKFLVY